MSAQNEIWGFEGGKNEDSDLLDYDSRSFIANYQRFLLNVLLLTIIFHSFLFSEQTLVITHETACYDNPEDDYKFGTLEENH
jgi:hypothetical protein